MGNKWTSEEEAALRKGDKWRSLNLARIDSPNANIGHYNESVAFIGEGSGKDGIAQPSTLAIAYESSEDENEKLASSSDCWLDPRQRVEIHQSPSPVPKPTSWKLIALVQQEREYVSAASDRVKAAVDAEVWRIRHMAEAAMAEAEEAEKEAVEAERLAEEKQSIADELERKLMEKKDRAGQVIRI
ncbi:hypothetical protein ACET3Z_026990 [Daucus carota]